MEDSSKTATPGTKDISPAVPSLIAERPWSTTLSVIDQSSVPRSNDNTMSTAPMTTSTVTISGFTSLELSKQSATSELRFTQNSNDMPLAPSLTSARPSLAKPSLFTVATPSNAPAANETSLTTDSLVSETEYVATLGTQEQSEPSKKAFHNSSGTESPLSTAISSAIPVSLNDQSSASINSDTRLLVTASSTAPTQAEPIKSTGTESLNTPNSTKQLPTPGMRGTTSLDALISIEPEVATSPDVTDPRLSGFPSRSEFTSTPSIENTFLSTISSRNDPAFETIPATTEYSVYSSLIDLDPTQNVSSVGLRLGPSSLDIPPFIPEMSEPTSAADSSREVQSFIYPSIKTPTAFQGSISMGVKTGMPILSVIDPARFQFTSGPSESRIFDILDPSKPRLAYLKLETSTDTNGLTHHSASNDNTPVTLAPVSTEEAEVDPVFFGGIEPQENKAKCGLVVCSDTPETSKQSYLHSLTDPADHASFATSVDEILSHFEWNAESNIFGSTKEYISSTDGEQITSTNVDAGVTAADFTTYNHATQVSAETSETTTLSTTFRADMAQLARIDGHQAVMEVHQQTIGVLFGTVFAGSAAFCGMILLHRRCYRQTKRPRKKRIYGKHNPSGPTCHGDPHKEISRFSEGS